METTNTQENDLTLPSNGRPRVLAQAKRGGHLKAVWVFAGRTKTAGTMHAKARGQVGHEAEVERAGPRMLAGSG